MITTDALARAEQVEVADALLSMMRHDVRNKLASARQAGYYLKSRSQTTELWAAEPRIEKFFGIIDDQLALADESMQPHSTFDRIHRSSPVSLDAVWVARSAVAASKCAKRVDVGAVEPGEVVADEAELTLALRCLLDNAAEASPDGPISFAGTKNDDRYLYSVTDAGAGMTKDEFRRFLRPFEGNRPGQRGLGLSMASRIASRYGGAIELLGGPSGACVELSVGPMPDGPPPSRGGEEAER